MAKYEVLQVSFINDTIVNVGDVVEYAGEPGPNLKAVDKAAKKAADAADVPTPVAVLVSTLRMHAVSRGVTADEVTAVDFDEVLKTLDPKPAADVISAAAAELKVDLGQSLA